MKAVKTLLATSLMALLSLPSVCGASPLTLNFENPDPALPTPFKPVQLKDRLDFVPLGITFSATAWVGAGLDVAGGEGGFTGDGAGGTNKFAVTLAGTPTGNPDPESFTVYVKNGFTGAFSLIFTGDEGTDATISLNDINGNALVTHGGASAGALCGFDFCNWNADLKLGDASDNSVTYYSVTVYGDSGKQWFDNFSFSNVLADPDPGRVPEPSGIALSLAALGGLAWTRRRANSKR